MGWVMGPSEHSTCSILLMEKLRPRAGGEKAEQGTRDSLAKDTELSHV